MFTDINVCMSGGAEGADHAWGLMALDRGHSLIHWSFGNHKSTTNTNTKILTADDLKQADPFLKIASKSLKRSWPSKSEYVNNLLRRNYYQVRSSQRIYAVAKLSNDSSLLGISGGTAWACQMYVDRWYTETNFKEIELYVFDQNTNKWMQWIEEWQEVSSLPCPHGVYAGIGSREITDAGIEAIFRAYG